MSRQIFTDMMFQLVAVVLTGMLPLLAVALTTVVWILALSGVLRLGVRELVTTLLTSIF